MFTIFFQTNNVCIASVIEKNIKNESGSCFVGFNLSMDEKTPELCSGGIGGNKSTRSCLRGLLAFVSILIIFRDIQFFKNFIKC